MRYRFFDLAHRLFKPILLLILAAVIAWRGIYGLPIERTCVWLSVMCAFTAAILVLTALGLLRSPEDGDEPD